MHLPMLIKKAHSRVDIAERLATIGNKDSAGKHIDIQVCAIDFCTAKGTRLVHSTHLNML